MDLCSAHVRWQMGTSFFWAAVCLGLADTLVVSLHPCADFESSYSVFKTLPQIILGFPLVIGLLVYGTASVLNWIAVKFVRQRANLLLYIVFCFVPVIFTTQLFSGAAIGSSIWRFPLMSAAVLTVCGALWYLGILTIALKSLESVKSTLIWVLVGFALLVLLVGGGLTQKVYPGLYISFHRLVSTGVLYTFAAIFFVILPGRNPKRKTLLRRNIFAAAVFAIYPLTSLLAQSAALGRQVLVERAVFVSPFVGAVFVAEQRAKRLLEPRPEKLSGNEVSGHALANFDGDSHRRNVLLITVDAMRGDVFDRDGPFSSVTMDLIRFKEQSLAYERAYSPGNNTPVSLPTLMLGYLPDDYLTATKRQECLASSFNAAGYKTFFHFTAHEFASLEGTTLWPLVTKGFYFYRYIKNYETVESVLKKVERELAGNDSPVFIWAHLSDLHSPFLLRNIQKNGLGGYENSYKGQAHYLNDILAPFLHRISQKYPDMVIGLSSDHGEALGEHNTHYHGSTLYDEQTRVPLVLSGPGTTATTIDSPVSLTHLGVTLLHLAGADFASEVDILPLKKVESAAYTADVLMVGNRLCGIVVGDFKLVVDASTGVVSLFNLQKDPGEQKNLVESQRKRAKQLFTRLESSSCPFELDLFHL